MALQVGSFKSSKEEDFGIRIVYMPFDQRQNLEGPHETSTKEDNRLKNLRDYVKTKAHLYIYKIISGYAMLCYER